MIITPQQDQALKAVSAWYKDPRSARFFYLGGYAGTGKTTLAKHFAASVSGVTFCAFTGKAALVMRQKGCPGASRPRTSARSRRTWSGRTMRRCRSAPSTRASPLRCWCEPSCWTRSASSRKKETPGDGRGSEFLTSWKEGVSCPTQHIACSICARN